MEEEERDARTVRAFDVLQGNIIITAAELPRRHIRKIYLSLCRHKYNLIEMKQVQRDGIVTLEQIIIDKLFPCEELVVYLAQAFLPRLATFRRYITGD
eukprot:3430609-Pleurochrysis_carterae.AAC.1